MSVMITPTAKVVNTIPTSPMPSVNASCSAGPIAGSPCWTHASAPVEADPTARIVQR